MTLNCVKPYKEKYPDDLIIYKAAAWIVELLRPVMIEAGIDGVVTTDVRFRCDKFFNLLGYLQPGYPEKPLARHLIEYFSEELGLGGRHEDPKLRLPERTIEGPYVALHATSGWSMYKNWPLDRWTWVCQRLRRQGIRVAQIGGSREQVVEGVELNRLSVPFIESLGILANADLLLGIDSWPNHATNIVWEGRGKVPGVILWGSTQMTASGYLQNKNISLGLPCQPCFRQDPRISGETRGPCPNPLGQTYESPRHACMHSIDREYVLDVILKEYAKVNHAYSDTSKFGLSVE